jgi:ribosomal protein S18 acetylase RimI-like enzyme
MIRPATDADLPLVKQTLYLALAWDPDDPIPPFEQVVDHPQIAIYHRGWMRPGDAGVVAEVEGAFAGMAYYRTFTTTEPGQGYVDSETPELAIAIVPEHRSCGLGGRLLDALADEARRTGVSRISLSVSTGNRARRLYERHGYVAVSEEDTEIMVLTL